MKEVAVYPFIPLKTEFLWSICIWLWLQCPWNSSPHSRFATLSCIFPNDPFSGLLQSSSPSGSLWIPNLCACFSMDSSPFLRVWLIHHHSLIVTGNIIGFSSVASHSSLLLFILGPLIPVILCIHRLMNICNLFIYLGSHFPGFTPYSSADLTFLIKYMDLKLRYIFILPQWVQFYKDHICLLDPCFNILEWSCIYCYNATQTRKFCHLIWQ